MKRCHLILIVIAFGSAFGGELARELTLDLGNNVTLKMVLIPPGKFTRGSSETGFDAWTWGRESPPHEVTISKPFYMSTHPLTTEQFDAVTGKKSPFIETSRRRPLSRISWVKAVDLCKKISEITKFNVQLPTEAQWEYACRAGTTSRWYFGNDATAMGDHAWTRKNTTDATGALINPSLRVRDVGKLKPNAWGLYDMHGNVSTWCSDWYGEYEKGPLVDPQGPSTGKRRIARGGSYYDPPERCASASRWAFVPDDHRGTIGVRVIVNAD